jgi:hypothetical protein
MAINKLEVSLFSSQRTDFRYRRKWGDCIYTIHHDENFFCKDQYFIPFFLGIVYFSFLSQFREKPSVWYLKGTLLFWIFCSLFSNIYGNVLTRATYVLHFINLKIFKVLELTWGNFSPDISPKPLLLGCIPSKILFSNYCKLLPEYPAESLNVTPVMMSSISKPFIEKNRAIELEGLYLNLPTTLP